MNNKPIIGIPCKQKKADKNDLWNRMEVVDALRDDLQPVEGDNYLIVKDY